MVELENNKQYNLLKWIFIIISIIHIAYATLTMRGMYMDGGFLMINYLNNFANNNFVIISDPMHPRFMILAIMQIPVMLGYFILQNKFSLMMLYSFVMFAFPLLFLFWNYKLSKRTNRIDVFFYSLLCYCSILITFSIFSVVESIIGVMLNFILWNYLVSKIEYKKFDIIGIVFLIIMMFGTYEYITYLGLMFFIAAIYYSSIETNKKSKYIKNIIGLGSLGASVFNILFMLGVSGESGEIQRFINELIFSFKHLNKLNFSISILTIALLIYFLFNKNKFSFWTIGTLAALYIWNFAILINNQISTVTPVLEGHFRTLPCIFLPIAFAILFIFDLLKRKADPIKYSNFICIVLLCGITQTCWQIVHTYYWNANIQYMKKELASTNEPLYIPAKHEPISSFYNKDLRRYIWHSTYTFTSILFSDTYEQKTILMHYDEEFEPANETYRDELFIAKYKPNTIHIPFGSGINIKNKYWDLTKCAQAIDKYNIENNIKTYDLKQQNLL